MLDRACVVYVCLAALPFCASAAGGPEARKADEPGGAKPKEFAQGVRIDWQTRAVEVDAKVVLREGPLELLACSPQTREHESIFSVAARPLHIFQALGLLGMEPGSPVRYDAKLKRQFPPTGEPLEIEVRHERAPKPVPVRDWLKDVELNRPPETVKWVFAGSRILDDGRLAADLDGTIICVVDFETALIAVGAIHTADNQHLWLAANTRAIPPIGTPCTIIIRRAAPAPIEVRLSKDGTFRLAGKPIDVEDLATLANREKPDGRIELCPDGNTPDETVKSAIDSLRAAGVDPAGIRVRAKENMTPPRRDPE
jgi:hypothetical protein